MKLPPVMFYIPRCQTDATIVYTLVVVRLFSVSHNTIQIGPVDKVHLARGEINCYTLNTSRSTFSV